MPSAVTDYDQLLSTPLWFRLLIVAALAGGLWWALRPRYSRRIVIHRGNIQLCIGVPKARAGEILEFLSGLQLEGKVVILGVRERRGNLRIAFRGRLHPGIGQRIRNYLKMIL